MADDKKLYDVEYAWREVDGTRVDDPHVLRLALTDTQAKLFKETYLPHEGSNVTGVIEVTSGR